jgi:DNA uptake protein ComE-like DNA-binding protein
MNPSTILNTALSRRGLIASAMAIGIAVPLSSRRGFAQESATVAATSAAWTKFNLDTVRAEEILTIPGAGDRMVREFEEYRPYTSVTQFREEIGKYVDADVVAGYERYLFVPVDPNSADAGTLMQLPGLDEEWANALIDQRPFAANDDFLAALGSIVSAEQAAVAPGYLTGSAGNEAVWPLLNLNAATDEQFMTIPGVGDNMLREFNEYRPYTSITQFRAEIGKYVDDDVVASYERYLYVPVDPGSADAPTLQQLPGVDEDLANQLLAGEPYATTNDFLSALAGMVSAEQAASAAAFLAEG